MPMGWHDAHKIAQIISTVVAAYRASGNSIPVDKTELPTIIAGQGFHIFVLVSVIFIVGIQDSVEEQIAGMSQNIRCFSIAHVPEGWRTCTFGDGEEITFAGTVMSKEGCR